MAEPANRRDKPGGGKYYEHPQTKEVFDSVTTVLDTFDKAGLKIWAGQLAARHAIEVLPALTAAVITQKCGNTYNRCYNKHGRDNRCERCPCRVCEECLYNTIAWRHAAESGRRAQEGTEVHDFAQHWVLNDGSHISVREEVKPYVASFLSWTRDYGLRPRSRSDAGSWSHTEVTLLNRQHRYAGTSDGVVTIARGAPKADELLGLLGVDRFTVRVDYKSREKPDEKVFNDQPLQGVAYNRCEVAMTDNGTEYPVPPADAVAILQLRPNGYSFVLMDDSDPVFDAFLGILTAHRWLDRDAKASYDQSTQIARLRTKLSRPIVARGLGDHELVSAITVDALAGQPDPDPDNPDHWVELVNEPTPELPVASDDDPWISWDEPAPGSWPDPAPDPVLRQVEESVAIVCTREPAKKAAPRKSAATKKAEAAGARDPWAAHGPAQQAQDATRQPANAIMASIQGFQPGKPVMSALDDQIPF